MRLINSPSTFAAGGHKVIIPLARIHPTPASGSNPSTRESTRIIERKLPPLLFLRVRVLVRTLFTVFIPELVSSAMDEYIFERRLADRNGLNFAGKCLDQVGNETMPAFAFDPHLVAQHCRFHAESRPDVVGQ